MLGGLRHHFFPAPQKGMSSPEVVELDGIPQVLISIAMLSNIIAISHMWLSAVIFKLMTITMKNSVPEFEFRCAVAPCSGYGTVGSAFPSPRTAYYAVPPGR